MGPPTTLCLISVPAATVGDRVILLAAWVVMGLRVLMLVFDTFGFSVNGVCLRFCARSCCPWSLRSCMTPVRPIPDFLCMIFVSTFIPACISRSCKVAQIKPWTATTSAQTKMHRVVFIGPMLRFSRPTVALSHWRWGICYFNCWSTPVVAWCGHYVTGDFDVGVDTSRAIVIANIISYHIL